MSVPRYARYRDSGVEWLGEVPAHWEVTRLRFVAEVNPSKSEIADLDRQTTVSFLPMEAIGDDGSLDLARERAVADVENGYTYFRDDDVTIAKITPCFENGKGAVMRGLTNGVGFGTTELIVVRPARDAASGEFLHFLFNTPAFRQLGESHMYGAGGQKRVPEAFVRDFTMALPCVAEQAQIARFLDRETAKLDALIAEQERLIALLKEKRQAVISHAVTRGLNPDAAMKPSGVEWLGEVPAHWDVMRVKHIVRSLEQGWSPQCDSFPVETADEWGVLKVGCVNGGRFDPAENKRLPDDLQPVPELALRTGDLLVSRANTRDLVGSAAVVCEDHSNLLLCDKLYRLRLDSAQCDPRFLAYFLLTGEARGQIELEATGASASMVNIGQSTIMELAFAVPPLAEQVEVVESLRGELATLDALGAEAGRAISVLQERRAALISAAVTGKIDVRGLAA